MSEECGLELLMRTTFTIESDVLAAVALDAGAGGRGICNAPFSSKRTVGSAVA